MGTGAILAFDHWVILQCPGGWHDSEVDPPHSIDRFYEHEDVTGVLLSNGAKEPELAIEAEHFLAGVS